MKHSVSFIYKNIHIYRMVMTLLYWGQYKARFAKALELIRSDDRVVVELCFGDVHIAAYCRERNIRWIGFDINPTFVAYARSKGFDAREADITRISEIPASDVCIMVDSLYHFYPDFRQLFAKIAGSSKRFILTEPVVNLSQQPGFLGALAKRFTNAGKGPESFRFDEHSLIATLEALRKEVAFDYRVVEKRRDMTVEIRWTETVSEQAQGDTA